MAGKKRMPKALASYFRKEQQAKLDGIPFTVTDAEMRAHIEWMRKHNLRSHFEAPK